MSANIFKDSERPFRAAGMSYDSNPYSTFTGFDTSGRPLYSNTKLAKSNNQQLALNKNNLLKNIFTNLNVFEKDDATRFEKIGAIASDVAFLGSLGISVQNKDPKRFVNILLNQFLPGEINKIKDLKTKDGSAAAFAAWKLYNRWPTMSDAQKGLAIGQLGIDAYKFASGNDIGSKVISKGTWKDGKKVTPDLTVGSAISLLQNGYSIYDTAKNWKDMSMLGRIAGGAQTVSNVVEIGKQLGTFSTQTASQAAAQSGSELTASQIGGYAGAVAGAAGLALGTKAIVDNWGSGSAEGRKQGAIAGAGAGLGATALFSLGATTAIPVVGAFVAVGLMSGTVKAGKHEDQNKRDNIRTGLQQSGLIDKDYKLSLPDGTLADLGIDGSGGIHKPRYADKILDKDRKARSGDDMRSYDVDYTNDLDYASSIPGITLSRILMGGSGKAVDQVGGQISNAALGKIGYGKDFTEDNYNAVMQNMRGMYSKAGIKNLNEYNQVLDQMMQQERISASEYAAAQQAGSMLYGDNSYNSAKKLMSGRWRGLEVANEVSDEDIVNQPEEINKPILEKPVEVVNKPDISEEDKKSVSIIAKRRAERGIR